MQIKQLEWEHHKATTNFGTYALHTGYGLLSGLWQLTFNGAALQGGTYRSVQAGMDGAQEDFEARINGHIDRTETLNP